jgi:hypothetical protein
MKTGNSLIAKRAVPEAVVRPLLIAAVLVGAKTERASPSKSARLTLNANRLNRVLTDCANPSAQAMPSATLETSVWLEPVAPHLHRTNHAPHRPNAEWIPA